MIVIDTAILEKEDYITYWELQLELEKTTFFLLFLKSIPTAWEWAWLKKIVILSQNYLIDINMRGWCLF